MRSTWVAKALVNEMPHTLTALAAGSLSEWQSMLIVRETATLSLEDRQQVDRILCGDPAGVSRLGDKRLIGELRKQAYRLDPESVVRRAADAARAAGDSRTRGQVMADTLVERVTGLSSAGTVPVRVDLVMSERALFGHVDEPTHVPGYGVVPADISRDWIRKAATSQAALWVRRLYTEAGRLVGLDARSRPTSEPNLQGLCEACSYAKEAPGWSARPRPGPRHTVETVTPTGHSYVSTVSTATGTPSRPFRRLEACFSDLVLTA